MKCKTMKVVGNAGDPSTADTQITVPTSRKERRCNCYRIRGKHHPRDCKYDTTPAGCTRRCCLPERVY